MAGLAGSGQAVGSRAVESQSRSSSIGLDAQRARSAAASFATHLGASSGQHVKAAKTPLSSGAAGDAIAKAYSELTGEPLDGRAKAILTAQWAHETGHGASMFNYNFGGIKGVGPSGLSVAQRTREGYGSGERQIVDQFRAYVDIDEGAKDYVKLLTARYGEAMTAAKQGDAEGFVRGLKQRGYFTGDPVAYARSIRSIAGQLTVGTESFTKDGDVGSLGTIARSDFATKALRQDDLPEGRSVGDPRAYGGFGAGAMLESRHLAALMAPPQPTALLVQAARNESETRMGLEGLEGAESAGADGLSAIRAMLMSDEVARSTLQLARGETERSAESPAWNPKQ